MINFGQFSTLVDFGQKWSIVSWKLVKSCAKMVDFVDFDQK
jgi:hypothetical protein